MGGENVTMNDLRLLRVMYDDLDREHYGLTLARAVGLGTATLYNSLARLERKNWVVSRWESIDPVQAGRPARKYFRLTERGIEGYRATLLAITPPALLRGLA